MKSIFLEMNIKYLVEPYHYFPVSLFSGFLALYSINLLRMRMSPEECLEQTAEDSPRQSKGETKKNFFFLDQMSPGHIGCSEFLTTIFDLCNSYLLGRH